MAGSLVNQMTATGLSGLVLAMVMLCLVIIHIVSTYLVNEMAATGLPDLYYQLGCFNKSLSPLQAQTW
jgi:hypothetical protein